MAVRGRNGLDYEEVNVDMTDAELRDARADALRIAQHWIAQAHAAAQLLYDRRAVDLLDRELAAFIGRAVDHVQDAYDYANGEKPWRTV